MIGRVINQKVRLLVLEQIQDGLDVRLLKGTLSMGLREAPGRLRKDWRIRRDALLQRISDAVEDTGREVWLCGGKMVLTHNQLEERWEW